MHLKKELSVSIISNWTRTLFVYLIAFIVTPIIVHSFGNERYGIWSIAMTFTGFYGVFDLGIRTTIIKYYAEYMERKEYQSANILVNTGLATFGFFILPAVAIVVSILIPNIERFFQLDPSYAKETKILFTITALNFCINAMVNPFRAVLVGLRKFTLNNGIEAFFLLIRSLCMVVLLKSGYGLVGAGVGILCVESVQNIVTIYFSFRICPQLQISPNLISFKEMKGAHSFTFFNFLRQLSIRVMERSDIVLIGIVLDVRMAAFYSIAESLVRSLAKIPKAIRETILPFSSKLHAGEQKEKIKKMAEIIPRYTMSFFLLTLLVAALFGRQFIELWMGPNYEISYGILLILLGAKAISMSQSMLAHIVLGMGHNRLPGLVGIFEIFLNIGSSILLAKKFGVYGIALGTLLTVVFTNGIFLPIYTYKKLQFKLANYYLTTIILPVLISLGVYSANAYLLNIKSFFWLPIIMLECAVLNYILVWKELSFKGGRLKFRT